MALFDDKRQNEVGKDEAEAWYEELRGHLDRRIDRTRNQPNHEKRLQANQRLIQHSGPPGTKAVAALAAQATKGGGKGKGKGKGRETKAKEAKLAKEIRKWKVAARLPIPSVPVTASVKVARVE